MHLLASSILAFIFLCRFVVSVPARHVFSINPANTTVGDLAPNATRTAMTATQTEFIWPVVSSFYLHIEIYPKRTMSEHDANEMLKRVDGVVGKKAPDALLTEELRYEIPGQMDLVFVITPVRGQDLTWADVKNTLLGLHEFFQDQLSMGRELCSTYFWVKDKKREMRFGEGALKRKSESLALDV